VEVPTIKQMTVYLPQSINTTITITIIMKCSKCGYEWIPRKDTPVSCPRCKRRMDWK